MDANEQKAYQLYCQIGASAVYDAARSGELEINGYAQCEPCDAETPIYKGECLCCGTPTTQNEVKQMAMFDVGCEFCGDEPRDLIYLKKYTDRIKEINISAGQPDKYIRSDEMFFLCSCGIVASSTDRTMYNEQIILTRDFADSINGSYYPSMLEFEQLDFWSRRFNIDDPVFFLERTQAHVECPF